MLSLSFSAIPVLAQNQSTNPAPRWLSNKEIRQKWADVSIETARNAADNGDVTAQDYLGMCYLAGDQVAAILRSPCPGSGGPAMPVSCPPPEKWGSFTNAEME